MATFSKRCGTTDYGKLYEDLIVSDLALQFVLDNRVNNFKLSSNNGKFGAFDDVVLEVESNNVKKIYAIQLKHTSSEKRQITLTNSKNFSLKSYSKSFKKIDNRTNCIFILMTNRTYSNENAPFDLENGKLSIVAKRTECHLFSTGYCHKFEILHSNTCCEKELEEYKKFFEKFLLLSNQPNASETQQNFVTKFQKIFSCNEDDVKQFLRFISEWSLRDGLKEMLDKRFIQEIIACCLLNSFINPIIRRDGSEQKKICDDVPEENKVDENVTEKTKICEDVTEEMKLLRTAIESFEVTIFKEESYGNVKALWREKITLEDDKEVCKIKKKFRIGDDSSKLNEVDLSKLLWLTNICPLIVTESKTTYKVIELCSHKKFILLKTKPEDEELRNRNIFRNLLDLVPKPKLYEPLVNAIKISIQEKEQITLKDFIATNSHLNSIISTNELVKMFENSYGIGGPQEKVPVPYIERFVARNFIDINYLKSISNDTLIVLDCMNKADDIKNRVGNFNMIAVPRFIKKLKDKAIESSTKFGPGHRFLYRSCPEIKNFVPGPDVYRSHNFCSSADFMTICEKNSNIKNVHHLKVENRDTLEWIRSKGDVSSLEKYRKKNTFVSEEVLRKETPDNNVNIVISESGMGKSDLLKKTKNESFPKHWTILMYPKDMALLCPRLTEKHDQKETELINFLVNKKYVNYSEFEKQVLTSLIKAGQVVYFWDALDELSPENADIIIKLIEELRSKSVCQMITARTHLKKQLEKTFCVLTKSIRQFNKKEQRFYIQHRLQNVVEIGKSKIDEIIEKINSAVTLMKQNDILGIPLQIFMLTELFQEDHKKYCALLEKVFSLTDLFQNIIDKRFDRYYKEKAFVNDQSEAMKQILNVFKENMCQKYEGASLKALITNELLKELNINCEEILKHLENKDCLGLITAIKDNFPQFLHNSYAEFFVAKYFAQHRDRIKDVKSILFDSRNVNIRFFFDLLTAEGSDAHVAVLCKNQDLLKQHSNLRGCSDKGGRSLLHIACSWGQRLPVLHAEKQGKIYVINNDDDDLYTEDSSEYAEMLDYLLNHCDITAFDEIYKEDTISYAERAECLIVKLKLLIKFNKEYSLAITDESLSMLYYSTKFGYNDIFKLLKEFPFVKTKKDDLSLLHLAMISGQENFLQNLLSLEAYKASIDYVDKHGETALYKACQNGFLSMSQMLIDSGAKINTGKHDGSTPLHTASLHHQLEIVRLLLDRGGNINITKNFGITPLHVACWNGHLSVVQHLVTRDADINVRSTDGCTPLYVASRNYNQAVVDYLLKAGVDVNLPQEDDVTPLCIASQEGHEKIVEYLLKAGANVDYRSTSGESPIYLASQIGCEVVVDMLIKYGCDVNVTTNDDGWTPLHIAAQQNYPKVIELLLKAGANVCALNKGGKTPLDVARIHKNNDIVSMLENAV